MFAGCYRLAKRIDQIVAPEWCGYTHFKFILYRIGPCLPVTQRHVASFNRTNRRIGKCAVVVNHFQPVKDDPNGRSEIVDIGVVPYTFRKTSSRYLSYLLPLTTVRATFYRKMRDILFLSRLPRQQNGIFSIRRLEGCQ